MGYCNTEVRYDGQQLQSAAFITIGVKDAANNNCVRLSDLKVTGYEESFGICYGSIWIDILETNGSVPEIDGMPKSYLWVDAPDDGFAAGWYDTDLNPLADDASVLGNADEITFACGEGICFNAKDGYEGCTFLCNGQVVQGQVDYVVALDGQQIAGNPLCRTIALSELSVIGYEESFGICYGSIWIDILETNGSVPEISGMPKSYLWVDAPDDGFAAGWYDTDLNPLTDDASVLGNAEDITWGMGEGICVNAKDGYEGCTLKFPALGL